MVWVSFPKATCMYWKSVAAKQGLAFQNLFLWKSFKFSKSWNHHEYLLLKFKCLKLAHFGYFCHTHAAILQKIYWLYDPSCKGPTIPAVLSGRPHLSGPLSKSQKLRPLITVILTSIKQSPLHCNKWLRSPFPTNWFLLSWPVLNSHFVKGNHSNMVINSAPGNWISNDLQHWL